MVHIICTSLAPALRFLPWSFIFHHHARSCVMQQLTHLICLCRRAWYTSSWPCIIPWSPIIMTHHHDYGVVCRSTWYTSSWTSIISCPMYVSMVHMIWPIMSHITCIHTHYLSLNYPGSFQVYGIYGWQTHTLGSCGAYQLHFSCFECAAINHHYIPLRKCIFGPFIITLCKAFVLIFIAFNLM